MKHTKTSVVNILGVPCLFTGVAAWLSVAGASQRRRKPPTSFGR